eukprot:9290840-Pyramimonas_sp.AAC.1
MSRLFQDCFKILIKILINWQGSGRRLGWLGLDWGLGGRPRIIRGRIELAGCPGRREFVHGWAIRGGMGPSGAPQELPLSLWDALHSSPGTSSMPSGTPKELPRCLPGHPRNFLNSFQSSPGTSSMPFDVPHELPLSLWDALQADHATSSIPSGPPKELPQCHLMGVGLAGGGLGAGRPSTDVELCWQGVRGEGGIRPRIDNPS